MVDANIRKLVVSMNMQELCDLQDLVVISMKRLQATATMMFRPGDQVTFQTRDGRTISATVLKKNQKTVSVVTYDTKKLWKVSGTLLKLKDAA